MAPVKYLKLFCLFFCHFNKFSTTFYFSKAASKGHPEASYNLAVAHMKGYKKLEPGWISMIVSSFPFNYLPLFFRHARKLIEHAAVNGVQQAKYIVNEGVCDHVGCEWTWREHEHNRSLNYKLLIR